MKELGYSADDIIELLQKGQGGIAMANIIEIRGLSKLYED